MADSREPSPHRGSYNQQQQQRHYDAHDASAGQDSDRLQLLEQQLQEMQVLLEAERQRHKEDRQAMSTKLRVLEAQARAEDDGEGRASQRARVKGTPNLGAYSDRTVHNTPRTADNLFVTIPSRSEPRERGDSHGHAHADAKAAMSAQRLAAKRAAQRPAAVRAAPANDRASASSRTSSAAASRAARGTVGSGADASVRSDRSPGRPASNATVGLSATQRRATALQHAWDKFCAAARSEFTPKELALVSAETLHSLMDHYKIRSSIERAQVEGQWALLQEGKQTVGDSATPKPAPSAKRSTIKRADHPTAFDLGGDLGKPHLSRRTALGDEGVKPSNPNESTSGSALVRSMSSTVTLLRPREAGQCNPNDTQSRSSTPRLCFRRAESPGPSKETPRGMRHVTAKESGEFTPRGIRSYGNTHMGGDAVKPNGVRTGIDGRPDGLTPRRGVRTFESGYEGSPTHKRKPSIHVATPPHLERSHLMTHTLSRNSGLTQHRQTADPHARRTPFALGDN